MFGELLPDDLSSDYPVYLFAREFGFAPDVTRKLDLRTYQRLLGMIEGEADGIRHRREWTA